MEKELAPIRARAKEIAGNPAKMKKDLAAGADHARSVASETMGEVKRKWVSPRSSGMADADVVQRAKSLLEDLAQAPRFAGSAEESESQARCRAELEARRIQLQGAAIRVLAGTGPVWAAARRGS